MKPFPLIVNLWPKFCARWVDQSASWGSGCCPWWRILALWVCWLWSASLLAADIQTCTIQGYVSDDQGQPLRGWMVRLTSSSHLPGSWRTTSDAKGFYRLPPLPPGVFDLAVVRDHKELLSKRRLQLNIGQTLELDLKLDRAELPLDDSATSNGGVRSSTTVLVEKDLRDVEEPALPIVDTARAGVVVSWNRERVERLPSDREPMTIASWSNGTIASRVASGQLSILGGQPYSNAFYIDGIRVSEPFRNQWQNYFNFDVLDEIALMAGGLDAEYGGFSGGVVQMRTVDVQEHFSLDASLYGAPSELRLENPTDTMRTGDTRFYVQTHGPIVKGKLRFLLSAVYEDQATEKRLYEPFFVQRDTDEVQVGLIPTKRFRRLSLLGKMVWQPLDWQRFTLWVHGDPSWLDNELQEPEIHPDAERQRYRGGMLLAGSAETRLTANLHVQSRISYNFHRNEVIPASNDLNTPSHLNLYNGGVTVNDFMHIDDRLYQLQMESSLQYDLTDLWGTHQLKIGVDGDVKWQAYFHGLAGGMRFLDSGLQFGTSSIDGIGDPYQVEVLVSPADLRTWSQRVGLFVQDVWKPSRTFTVRPGIRFDSARSFRDVDFGGGAAYEFNYLSPRLGFAWDPFGDHKSVVRGGYFQYMETGMLLLAQVGGNEPVVDTYQYNPATSRYDAFVQRRGNEATQFTEAATSPPVTHEWMLGFERELSEHTTMGIVGIYRRSANLFEDEETNIQWNADGSAATGFQNGIATTVFTYGTPEEAFRRYTALQLSLDKALHDGWQLWAVYTLSRLMGTSDSPFSNSFNNPRQRPFEYGWLTDDVTQVARLGFSFEFPLGIQLGAVGTYLSGAPYDQFHYNEYFAAYIDRRAPRGCDPSKDWSRAEDCEQLRLPDSFSLDVRLLWSLEELTTQDISLVVDVFNAFHTRSVTAVEQRMVSDAEKTFGQPLQIAEPLRGRLGLRVRF